METARPRNGPRRLLALLCLLVSAESASYVGGRILQKKWCMFGVPKPPADRVETTYEDYLRRRDPEIGWPLPEQYGGKLLDVYGARPSPAFPDTTPETSRVSLYGDSFTQSASSDEDAWGNVLARLSGWRVSNYGQGGYGTDQAFLRYVRNVADRSAYVVLGHLSEDILRNLTRNRDLLTYEMFYAYKPRFVLGADGALGLVPIPKLSTDEHERFIGVKSPPFDLENESFAPGGPAGATLLRFPFTLAFARNFGDFRMRARLSRRPWWAEFYAPGHPLHGLEITAGICRAFVAEAKRRGQRPIVLLLPNKEELVRFRANRETYYRPLADALASNGVDFVDFCPALAAFAEGKDLEQVYDGTQHFAAPTDRRLAEFVLEKIRSLERSSPSSGH
jgi:hypothetical protein